MKRWVAGWVELLSAGQLCSIPTVMVVEDLNSVWLKHGEGNPIYSLDDDHCPGHTP